MNGTFFSASPRAFKKAASGGRRPAGPFWLGLAAAALAFAGSAAAAPNSSRALDVALDGLGARYQGLTSLAADYVRTTVSPASDSVFGHQAVQTARGRLQWRRLAQLRLDQSAPNEELMVTDGETVWWHIPDEKLVYVYRNLDLTGELAPLLSFFSGLEALRDNFAVTAVGPADAREGLTGLALKSKQDPQSPGRVVVYADADNQLAGFRLSSPTGEKTDFFLYELIVDPQQSEGLFTFKIPRGVTVVEEEQ
ncbi:MAG: outer membrane lipoprotein carrier protein LolA [Deltaproteobacteria bacterium]|nr:outer membrane lipoprotein carrier protein LolA [Deltaproteobacteria bacterium]